MHIFPETYTIIEVHLFKMGEIILGLTIRHSFWKRFWPVLPVAVLFVCSVWNWKKENIHQQNAAIQVDFAMNTVVEYCFYGEEGA